MSSRQSCGLFVLDLVVVLGAYSMVRAQCQQAVEVDSSHPVAGDSFGHAVDVNGDVAIVSSLFHDDGAADSGAVYIYRLDGLNWTAEAELTAADGATFDYYGNSVAIEGDVAVVGANFHDGLCPGNPNCDSGAVYVYRYDGALWQEVTVLTASDAEEGDQFGLPVAIDGDVIVVGAVSEGSLNQGAVYVFRYDGVGWTEEAKLTASDAEPGDSFGYGLDVDADLIVAGATYGGGPVADSGSAYVYRFNGTDWIEEIEFNAFDAEPIEWFGWSVAVDGDVVLVSSRLDDDGGCSSGSAYPFRYVDGVWTKENKIVAPDAAADDAFGASLSLDGDQALIGAWGDNGPMAPVAGSAYVYEFDGLDWSFAAKLRVPNSEVGGNYEFGWSVALDGGVAVIGAPGDDDFGVEAGSAFLFLLEADCNGNDIPDGCDIEDGTSADKNGNGIPDECEAPPPCDGDANGDGIVDPLDSGYVLARLGCEVGVGDPDCDAADVNADGTVDPLDVGYVLARFGACE